MTLYGVQGFAFKGLSRLAASTQYIHTYCSRVRSTVPCTSMHDKGPCIQVTAIEFCGVVQWLHARDAPADTPATYSIPENCRGFGVPPVRFSWYGEAVTLRVCWVVSILQGRDKVDSSMI